jgi:hypothetical protein
MRTITTTGATARSRYRATRRGSPHATSVSFIGEFLTLLPLLTLLRLTA